MKDWKPYTFNDAVECNPKDGGCLYVNPEGF